MFQVRFHGRGGQGVVTAAELLASAGNRAQLDAAVGVKSVERFLEDEALRKGWQIPVDAAPMGKRVLVVGAGPSGLSAAYHLARLGTGSPSRMRAPRPAA